MYFSPVEFLVLICGLYPACYQHFYVDVLYCDDFYKALQSQLAGTSAKAPNSYFSSLQPARSCSPAPSLHGNTAALQGVVTYGQCCHWAGTWQVRASAAEDWHLQRQCSGLSPWNKPGRKKKGFQLTFQGRWQTKAWEWTLYHTDKSWKKSYNMSSFIADT